MLRRWSIFLKFTHYQSQHNGAKILDQSYVHLVEFYSAIQHKKIDHTRNYKYIHL